MFNVLILGVDNKPLVLSVVMLNGAVLSVIMLNVGATFFGGGGAQN